MDIYQRTKILLGDSALEKIKKSSVCVCGAGGVGSYAIEALARVGISDITVIDKDVVDVTNINRQLIAFYNWNVKSKSCRRQNKRYK